MAIAPSAPVRDGDTRQPQPRLLLELAPALAPDEPELLVSLEPLPPAPLVELLPALAPRTGVEVAAPPAPPVPWAGVPHWP